MLGIGGTWYVKPKVPESVVAVDEKKKITPKKIPEATKTTEAKKTNLTKDKSYNRDSKCHVM